MERRDSSSEYYYNIFLKLYDKQALSEVVVTALGIRRDEKQVVKGGGGTFTTVCVTRSA